ncbi:MAG: NAD(P)-dependent oxidoreductase [Dorea sp.]|nr:NAD(P)-dependent oxidoreductase [Dorea sp.]
MKVAVAGANSFIGREILKIFGFKNNMEITAIVRRDCTFDFSLYENVYKVVQCDMEEYRSLGEMVGKGDCFINLSWNGSRGAARQNAELQKRNYQLYMDAMRSMADTGYTILVTAGSQAEYGRCKSVITEQTLMNPNTEYGRYKAEVYFDVAELAKKYNIRFIEPRYFSLYGPYDYNKTLIMTCIRKFMKNEECILNDCSQIWDFLYVTDAVEALYGLCISDGACGVYNFASGRHRMLKEFVMDIHRGIRSRSNVCFESLASSYDGLIYDLRPSVNKLMRDADWKPSTTFIEGIRKIIRECKLL